jgi:hypothetical protein
LAESVLVEAAQIEVAQVDIALAAAVLMGIASAAVEYIEAVLGLLGWLDFLERQGCLE